MIRRRDVITLLAVAAAAWPSAARAQQRAKLAVGFLVSGAPSRGNLEAFRQGLIQAGYAEGQNIIIQYRYAEGKFDRLPAFG
jgi:hypothetical protein